VEVVRPTRLCAPSDKNGEDPTASLDPEHFIGYEIRRAEPQFAKLKGQQIVNQFGTLTADLVKPELLMVPTAKDLTQSPNELAPGLINHFTCYRVRGAKFKASDLPIEDQIAPYVIDIKKPFRLCVPTDKENEGIVDPAALLACYKEASMPKRPPFAGPFFTNNQFGPMSVFLTRTREFCVPSAFVE
jgi:hypothetical protein